MRAYWTIGGDFVIADDMDDDAPLVTVTIHDAAMREMAATDRSTFAQSLAEAIAHSPHPWEDQ